MVKKLPPQIVCGAKQPSFAFSTASERWPKIVAGIVDKLHQSHHKTVKEQGEKAGEDVNTVIGKLSEIRYRIMTDKPLDPFEENVSDASIWNMELKRLDQINGKPISWFCGPWLFVECYLYRRIHDFFQQTEFLRNYDPFWEDKIKGHENSSKYFLAIGTELVNLLDNQLGKEETNKSLFRLIQISLWGNKCDLSLTGGDPHSMSATIFHELDELEPNILANDLAQAIDRHLLDSDPIKSKQIDIVLDNAGLELFTDLCLGDFLFTKGLACKIVFHGKEFPWFVSDTLKRDLDWMLQQFSAHSDPILNKLGLRWRNHFNQNIFEFRAHPFWTQCFEYCRMEEKSPDLYQQMCHSSLIIFKGDLNYRKLVADRQWPWQTPFQDSLCGFSPANLLTLRTLKAETVAGLSAEAVQKIASKFGAKDLSWMTSSDYAVAQLFEASEKK